MSCYKISSSPPGNYIRLAYYPLFIQLLQQVFRLLLVVCFRWFLSYRHFGLTVVPISVTRAPLSVISVTPFNISFVSRLVDSPRPVQFGPVQFIHTSFVFVTTCECVSRLPRHSPNTREQHASQPRVIRQPPNLQPAATLPFDSPGSVTSTCFLLQLSTSYQLNQQAYLLALALFHKPTIIPLPWRTCRAHHPQFRPAISAPLLSRSNATAIVPPSGRTARVLFTVTASRLSILWTPSILRTSKSGRVRSRKFPLVTLAAQ